MNAVTLVLPYYENPRQLDLQIAYLQALPESLRRFIQLVVVDDGSRDHPLDRWVAAAPGNPGCAFKVFRISKDVRWNWMAARNIGAFEADHEWLLLTDIDHVPAERTWLGLLTGSWDSGRVYDFARIDAPGLLENPKRHPNSWFMTIKTFWKRVGGVDERWAGTYGSDSEFRRRCEASTGKIKHLDLPLIRHPAEHFPDAITRRYDRKTPEDARRRRLLRAQIAASPKPHTLTYDYTQLLALDHQGREVIPE